MKLPFRHFLCLGLFAFCRTAECSQADGSKPPCYVDLPVYDATGNRVPSEIISAFPLSANHRDKRANALDLTGADRMVRVRDRLYFSKSAMGASYEVFLESSMGARIRARVELQRCAQRTSLRYGAQGTGYDVAATKMTGSIAGCELGGDWWIRIAPMFGINEAPVNFDAAVASKDGSFSLSASLNGERQILVIGKGRDPVKVIGINVTHGGNNHIGTVRLDGACPK